MCPANYYTPMMLSPEFAKMYGLLSPPVYHSMLRVHHQQQQQQQQPSSSFLMENLLNGHNHAFRGMATTATDLRIRQSPEPAAHGGSERDGAGGEDGTARSPPIRVAGQKDNTSGHRTTASTPYLKFGVNAILSSEISPKAGKFSFISLFTSLYIFTYLPILAHSAKNVFKGLSSIFFNSTIKNYQSNCFVTVEVA